MSGKRNVLTQRVSTNMKSTVEKIVNISPILITLNSEIIFRNIEHNIVRTTVTSETVQAEYLI